MFKDSVAFPRTDAIVKSFAFGVANDVSATLLKKPYDGVLGMGFAQKACKHFNHSKVVSQLKFPLALSLESQPPLFQMLMPELESPVFALDFQAQTTESRNAPTIELGRIDHTRYTGQLAKVIINSTTGHWATMNVTYSIRGQRMSEGADLIFGNQHLSYLPQLAVADMYFEDTGADAIINAPFSVVEQYYQNLSGLPGGYQQALNQGLEYAGPCTLVAPCNLAWPNIDLHLGDGIARIHGKFMSGRRLGNDTHPVRQNGTVSSYSSVSKSIEKTFNLFVL